MPCQQTFSEPQLLQVYAGLLGKDSRMNFQPNSDDLSHIHAKDSGMNFQPNSDDLSHIHAKDSGELSAQQ